MRTKFRGAQSRDRDFRGQKSAKSGLTILNRYISVTTTTNKKEFVFFEHTTYDETRHKGSGQKDPEQKGADIRAQGHKGAET